VSYTKGPWEVSKATGFSIWASQSRQIATCAVKVCRQDEKDCRDNARLIAAAPELLEALQKLVNECKGIISLEGPEIRGLISNTNFAVWELRVKEAEAAIAKVKGEGK
jgi:hypothetical protein